MQQQSKGLLSNDIKKNTEYVRYKHKHITTSSDSRYANSSEAHKCYFYE